MTVDKGIFIKNIYYMLSYAFHVLRRKEYENIAAEDFDDIEDMFAAILSTGLSRQIKLGLYKEYIPVEENMISLKGKLDINESIRNRLQRKKLLYCCFDELSIDNIYNQVIKTTILYLLKQKNVKPERKVLLKKDLIHFNSVHEISKSEIRWDSLRFTKNNQEYRMILNICKFVLSDLIFTTEKGSHRVISFFDEQQMHSLYEKFILEYYRRHHPELSPNPDYVNWDTEDDTYLLPKMLTDITLKKNCKTLIIDAKYYEHNLKTNFDVKTISSANLYQIYAYVKNMDKNNTGNVAGMLLYAKTEEKIQPDQKYMIGGNRISVKTLDLNLPFSEIANQLEKIQEDFFDNECA